MMDPKPEARVKDPEALKRFRLENLGEPCDFDCGRTGTDAHHKTFRSQGGDDAAENLLWLPPLPPLPRRHPLWPIGEIQMRRCANCTDKRPDSDLFWHRGDRKWYCQAVFVCEQRLEYLVQRGRPDDLDRIRLRDVDASGVTVA